MLIEYPKYESYEILKSEFLPILAKLAQLFEGLKPSRVGLRYVNQIRLDEPNPTDWTAYINPLLLSFFSFPPEPDRKALSRVLLNLELSFDFFNLRYRSGMPNPDFPASIRQKLFALDLDAYTQTFVDVSELERVLDTFHSTVQGYFESSITERLRSIMHESS